MRVQFLKCWPAPFVEVAEERKPYEIREDDRDYRVGDVLVLREWIPDLKCYAGRFVARVVTYKTSGGEWGIPEGLCVLGMKPTDPPCHHSYFVDGTVDDLDAHVAAMRAPHEARQAEAAQKGGA